MNGLHGPLGFSGIIGMKKLDWKWYVLKRMENRGRRTTTESLPQPLLLLLPFVF
jgi:hypothetical protein